MKNKAIVETGSMGSYQLFFNKSTDAVRIASKDVFYNGNKIEATMYFELKDGFWQNIKDNREKIKMFNRFRSVTKTIRNKIVTDMHLSLTTYLLKNSVVA